MRFLHRLLSRCVSWLPHKWPRSHGKSNPEELPIPRVLAASELVTRFVCSERQIRKASARPKPGAFNPSPYMELSVVHSSGLSDLELWEIGRKTLSGEVGRDHIYGRADVPVVSLADVKLRALRDDKPFVRHTSVIDWPIGSDGNETKALWKQITLELSEDLRINFTFPAMPIGQQ